MSASVIGDHRPDLLGCFGRQHQHADGFRDLCEIRARIAVVPQRTPLPATLPTGFYLLSQATWADISAIAPGEPGAASADGRWRPLWAVGTDQLAKRRRAGRASP